MNAGFEAVLLSKMTEQKCKVSIVKSYRDFAKSFISFRDYCFRHQQIYQKELSEEYKVYNTETSLYRICPGKERELLWREQIEIVAHNKIKKVIKDFNNELRRTLAENEMLIVN